MAPAYTNEYSTAVDRAAFYRLERAGCLRISDQDRVGFLQRQTTNDMSLLSPDRSILTVLVSPTARILDVLRLLQEENSIAILTLPGHATDTFNYLRNRIFFMDKVTLADASDDYAQLDLLGPQASDLIRRLGADALPEQDHVSDGEIAGESVRVIGAGSPDCLGHRLLVPSNACPAVEAALAELGAARLTADTYQMLRVERGIPAAGFELVEEYTPLEAGLGSAVSGSKGCYTGQEIIARQVTYDKVTQSLVGLQLESPAQPGERIWADGKPIGKITSSVVSPRFGQIALAIVKRPHDQPGSTVQPGEDSETSRGNRPAVVHSLPFS